MIASINITVIFACMVILIRIKTPVGYVLLINAGLAALLFRMNPRQIVSAVGTGAFSLDTLHLLGVIILIIAMGTIMKMVGSFDRAIASLEALLADTRAVMAVIPAIIGLLPMPGGAMLSAPMVDTVSNRTETSPEQKTLINYWFRHVWEYIWPLYPGIILTADLLKVPVRNIVAVNLPLTLAAILGGVLFCFRGIARRSVAHARKPSREHVRQLPQSLWPILVIIVATVFLGTPLLLSLSVVCGILLIMHRLNKQQLRELARDSITVETISLIVGVKVFQSVIDRSGAASQVVDAFASANILPSILIFVVPFVIGVLTGITMAFVGVTFPVLMPFFLEQQGGVAYPYLVLAYAAGFLGVIFSPVHLCLILTKDYYRADFGIVYKLLSRPAFVVLLVAVVWSLFGAEPFARWTGL
jgi:integral membrane protein (TIGR00529 family)